MKNEQIELLKTQLRNGDVQVTFEKSDGTERIMRCTLSESKIPEQSKPKNTGKKSNDQVLPVFDLDKNAWRSFRLNSVKYFQLT